MNKCKRCLLYEMADSAAYESIKSFLDSMPASEKTDDATYKQRLEICRDCESFMAAMCRRCGCYVEVRAIGKKADCPSKKW